ncbi:hypothetical protein Hanom_Chr07g00637551 [Helianthus anomalus]
MAYEAKETGLECPSWPIDSWVAKLKELGGKAVADKAGEKKDDGEDAGEDAA